MNRPDFATVIVDRVERSAKRGGVAGALIQTAIDQVDLAQCTRSDLDLWLGKAKATLAEALGILDGSIDLEERRAA